MSGKYPTRLEHVARIDENNLLQAVEHNSASVAITTSSSEIHYTNCYFCDLTGYRFQEGIGKNPPLLKGNDDYIGHKLPWQTLLGDEQWLR